MGRAVVTRVRCQLSKDYVTVREAKGRGRCMSAVVWTKGTVLRGLSDQEPLTEAPSLRTPADSFLPVCKLTEAVFPTKAWKAPPPLLSGRPLPPMSSTPGVHASSLSVP